MLQKIEGMNLRFNFCIFVHIQQSVNPVNQSGGIQGVIEVSTFLWALLLTCTSESWTSKNSCVCICSIAYKHFSIYRQIHVNEILVYMYEYIERKAYCIFNFVLIRNFMIQ